MQVTTPPGFLTFNTGAIKGNTLVYNFKLFRNPGRYCHRNRSIVNINYFLTVSAHEMLVHLRVSVIAGRGMERIDLDAEVGRL